MHKLVILSGVLLSINVYAPDAYSTRLIIDSPIKEGEFIDRTDIEEVVVKEGRGIEEIPDYAFLGCISLRKVSLPPGLKKIGFQAFSECSGLEEINLPASLEDIGSNSFTYCSSLGTLAFPLRLRHIGHNAFSFSGLQEAILPDNVEEIESYAFSDCPDLKKVKLPANDRLLGELMMNCCPKLTEIISPAPGVPRIDCESYIFDPEDTAAYEKCVLKVPGYLIDEYNVSNSWHLFNKIAM